MWLKYCFLGIFSLKLLLLLVHIPHYYKEITMDICLRNKEDVSLQLGQNDCTDVFVIPLQRESVSAPYAPIHLMIYLFQDELIIFLVPKVIMKY